VLQDSEKWVSAVREQPILTSAGTSALHMDDAKRQQLSVSSGVGARQDGVPLGPRQVRQKYLLLVRVN
jgi:hypothetical protein